MCSLIPSACCITSADSLPFSVVDKKSRIPFAFFCVFADVLYISRSQKQNFVCVCVCRCGVLSSAQTLISFINFTSLRSCCIASGVRILCDNIWHNYSASRLESLCFKTNKKQKNTTVFSLNERKCAECSEKFTDLRSSRYAFLKETVTINSIKKSGKGHYTVPAFIYVISPDTTYEKLEPTHSCR